TLRLARENVRERPLAVRLEHDARGRGDDIRGCVPYELRVADQHQPLAGAPASLELVAGKEHRPALAGEIRWRNQPGNLEKRDPAPGVERQAAHHLIFLRRLEDDLLALGAAIEPGPDERSPRQE